MHIKKLLSLILCAALLLSESVITLVPAAAVTGDTYYIDSIEGDNSNQGNSEAEAWKDLGGLANQNLGVGMTVDFDSGTNNCTYQYIYSHDNQRFIVNNAKPKPTGHLQKQMPCFLSYMRIKTDTINPFRNSNYAINAFQEAFRGKCRISLPFQTTNQEILPPMPVQPC